MSTSDSESSQVAPASPSNPDDVIQRFVEQQAQEILLRKEELELKKRELEHSYAHAQRILEAQSQDRREIRAHEQTNNKRGARLFFLILLALVLVGGYALHLNKDYLVVAIVKDVGLLLAGGISGYSIRIVKERNNPPPTT